MTTGARTRRGVLKGAVALAALAALPARAQEKVELIFSNFLANSTETPNVQAALKRYREKYPDVTVTEQTASHDEYLTQFNVGAASGEVPDVFMLNGSDTTSIVNAGLMGDITKDFYDDAEWGGLTPKSMTFEFTRDDKVYGVPYGQIITHVIYWNEDIFKKKRHRRVPRDVEGLPCRRGYAPGGRHHADLSRQQGALGRGRPLHEHARLSPHRRRVRARHVCRQGQAERAGIRGRDQQHAGTGSA